VTYVWKLFDDFFVFVQFFRFRETVLVIESDNEEDSGLFIDEIIVV